MWRYSGYFWNVTLNMKLFVHEDKLFVHEDKLFVHEDKLLFRDFNARCEYRCYFWMLHEDEGWC